MRKSIQLINSVSRATLLRKDQMLKSRTILTRNMRISMNYLSAFKFSETIQKSKTESMTFKAETKRLLDIVAKSIYTDKDVFVRELLSNASDALEKQKYQQRIGTSQSTDELQIDVELDEAKRTITIFDTGCGMTRESLIEDLGTIARSGSKKFVEETKGQDSSISDGIIGQFGVGFYSSFIVGDTVEVISKTEKSEKASLWVSDGSGTFEISEIENVGFERGTKIIIHLRADCAQFSKKAEIQKIIQRYSNFINHPISINGEIQNLVQATWSKDKSTVKEEEYKKFWEFISNSKAEYKYKLHYSTDAPLEIKALLYVPATHTEKYGIQMEDIDITLYSRKVVIKQKCRELLPHYLRFVKGAVDCEDIPLNISRENYQDSALIAKLNQILTRRILKMLEEEANKDPEGYLRWYNEFNVFLKEGLAMDQMNQDQIMRLCRYQANFTDKAISMDEYISKMEKDQDKIYYLLAPSRDLALKSPYYEPFIGKDIPVVILNMNLDEMVFKNINQYKNFRFINIENEFE